MTTENKPHAVNEPTKGSIILQLETGTKGSTDPKTSYKICEITESQVSSLSNIGEMIEKSSMEEIQTAMIFTPFIPAFHYSAFYDGKKILLKKGDSTLKTRVGDEALSLIKIIEGICKGTKNTDSHSIPSIRKGVK